MAAHSSTNGYQVHSRTSSTPASTSTLRPRVGRLISGLDEDTFTEIKTTSTGRAASPRGTPGTSRPVSPVPARHPSRTNPSDRTFGFGPSPKVRRDQSAGGFTSLLGSSWTSIQGLASTVLGGPGSATPPGGSSPRRNPRDVRRPHTRAATSEPPQKWGSTQYKAPIGVGSDQERAALVREAKRKDLLAADGQIAQDVLGRHKRRQSDDVTNHVVQEQEDEDALIYVHNVKLGDNIAQYKEESEKVRPLSFISCKFPWLTIPCRKISTKTATSSISPTARAPPAHPTHPPTLISRNRSRNCPSTLRKSDAFIPHRSLLSGHSS